MITEQQADSEIMLRGYTALAENPYFIALCMILQQEARKDSDRLSVAGTEASLDGVLFLLAQQQAVGKVQGLLRMEQLLRSTISVFQDQVRQKNEQPVGHVNEEVI